MYTVKEFFYKNEENKIKSITSAVCENKDSMLKAYEKFIDEAKIHNEATNDGFTILKVVLYENEDVLEETVISE